jgi:hypothetical protein
MVLLVEENESFEPNDMGLFGAYARAIEANAVADLAEEIRLVGHQMPTV